MAVVLCFGIVFTTGPAFAADKFDILMDKLVSKGVLSEADAVDIRNEVEMEAASQTASAPATKKETPANWAEKIKVKGDLRLRHQWEDRDEDGAPVRNRDRARFRLGLETDVNEKLKLGAGVATGGTNPRSTNQTFQDTFATKSLDLDYVYADYKPFDWAEVFGGKFPGEKVIWEPAEMLWDTDIRPEGAGSVLTSDVSDNLKLALNSGVFVLDEASTTTNNPWMYFVQPSVKWGISDNVSLKTAASYYGIDSNNNDIDNSSDTNTKAGANHKYDYDSIVPVVELGITEPLGGIVPYFALFGEYVKAFDPDDRNEGYASGFKFGDKKVGDKGSWQFKYVYKYLQQDAWFDALSDLDTYDGETNIKGHRLSIQYALCPNVSFGLAYYYIEPIQDIASATQTENQKEQKAQADFMFNF